MGADMGTASTKGTAALVTALILSACGGSTQKAPSVYGRYSSVSPFGVSLLELRPRNTYIQIESGGDTISGSYAVRADTVFLGQKDYLGERRTPYPLIWRGDSLVLGYLQSVVYIREGSSAAEPSPARQGGR